MHVLFDNILWKRFVDKFILPPSSLSSSINHSSSTLKSQKSPEHNTKNTCSARCQHADGSTQTMTSSTYQTELHHTLRVWRNSIYTKSWEGDSWISSAGHHHHPIARPSTTTYGTPWSKRSTVDDARHLKEKNIKKVWLGCSEIKVLRSALLQFRPRLKEVIRQEGGAIKQIYE